MPSDEITFFRGAEPMHGCSVADVIRHIRADPGGAYFKQVVGETKTRIDPRFAHCQFICHRVNDRETLSHIDPLFGVEIDVRTVAVVRRVVDSRKTRHCRRRSPYSVT